MQRSSLYSLLFAFFLLTVFTHQTLDRLSSPSVGPVAPTRIVSLAPSVTETLYALGLGPNVVGVTQFCIYPPDVAAKARVAGFSDVYFEAVVRARPDLVALPIDKVENKEWLERLGLSVLTLDTRTLSGLMNGIAKLGETTGHSPEAEAILDEFRKGLQAAEARASGRTRPRVLFSVMHSYQGLGYITEINAVGRDGFYNELIEAAGGTNVYQGSLAFPRLSRGSVVFLNPDVIIDVIPANEDLDAVRRDWESLGTVKAIREKRLYFFTDSADTVPGPRSVQTLAKLSLAFHPEHPDAHGGNLP